MTTKKQIEDFAIETAKDNIEKMKNLYLISQQIEKTEQSFYDWNHTIFLALMKKDDNDNN